MDNFFKFDNDDFILVDDDYVKTENKISPSHVLTSEEVLLGWDEQTASAQPTTSPLEALKARMRTSSGTETAENKTEQKKEAAQSKPEEKTENQEPQSLLKKLKRYTVDEEGHDLSQNAEPLYELQSVADIIKSDGERALKELSKKYNVAIPSVCAGGLNAAIVIIISVFSKVATCIFCMSFKAASTNIEITNNDFLNTYIFCNLIYIL